MLKKIVIIGAGNVASHLGLALKKSGYNISQVYSRHIANAECLSSLVDAVAIDDLSKITVDADIYIISVSDGVVEAVANSMPMVEGIVVHTAGSIEMSVLDRFSLHGVLYPFQTFTKQKELDFYQVPLLVKGNVSFSNNTLLELAESISCNVQQASDSKRKALHISAVFACNFVNHLYALSDELLEKEGLNFSLLAPLIKETTQKALSMKPLYAQTGPAIRGDQAVINSHLKALKMDSFYHDIYLLLSDSIAKLPNDK